MQVAGQVVVVTGGANGIGRALCEAFHRAGAAKVVVADLDTAGAEAVAASIDGAAFKCDVGQENDIRRLIEETEQKFGPIARQVEDRFVHQVLDNGGAANIHDERDPRLERGDVGEILVGADADIDAARNRPRLQFRDDLLVGALVRDQSAPTWIRTRDLVLMRDLLCR